MDILTPGDVIRDIGMAIFIISIMLMDTMNMVITTDKKAPVYGHIDGGGSGRKISVANGDNAIRQGWYPGAYPKGNGVTLADRLGRRSNEPMNGSLLVLVEGEPKSFVPPCPFYV